MPEEREPFVPAAVTGRTATQDVMFALSKDGPSLSKG